MLIIQITLKINFAILLGVIFGNIAVFNNIFTTFPGLLKHPQRNDAHFELFFTKIEVC